MRWTGSSCTRLPATFDVQWLSRQGSPLVTFRWCAANYTLSILVHQRLQAAGASRPSFLSCRLPPALTELPSSVTRASWALICSAPVPACWHVSCCWSSPAMLPLLHGRLPSAGICGLAGICVLAGICSDRHPLMGILSGIRVAGRSRHIIVLSCLMSAVSSLFLSSTYS